MYEAVKAWSAGVVVVTFVIVALLLLWSRYKRAFASVAEWSGEVMEGAAEVASKGIALSMGTGLIYAACYIFHRIGVSILKVFN